MTSPSELTDRIKIWTELQSWLINILHVLSYFQGLSVFWRLEGHESLNSFQACEVEEVPGGVLVTR